MKKKIISFILSCAIVSSFIPFALAANSITYRSVNATKSAVMLAFDGMSATETIDKAQSSGSIKLVKYQDGAMVEVETSDITCTQNSVVITPKGGVTEGVKYKVMLGDGVITTGGTPISSATETSWFEVDEVFFDDFTVTRDSSGNLTAPYYLDGTRILSKYWKVNSRWYIDEATGKMNERSTAGYMSLLKEEIGLSDVTLGEYTVEADIEMPRELYGGPLEVTLKPYYTDTGARTNGYCFRIPDYGPLNNWSSLQILELSGLTIRENNTDVTTIGAYSVPKSYTGRYVVADNKAEWYMNSDKVGEYVYDTLEGKEKIVTFAVGAGYTNFTIDNISITKCIENIEILKHKLTYNNDTSKISFTLSDATDIYEKGISYTLTEMTAEGDKEVAASMATAGNVLTITPDGGFTDGALYKVNVSGARDTSNETLAADDVMVFFTVSNNELTKMNVDYPSITLKGVTAEPNNQRIAIEFTYAGTFASKSEYKVYTSDNAERGFSSIAEGKLVATEGDVMYVEVGEKLIDKYYYVEITPKDEKGLTGDVETTATQKGFFKPTLTDVAISGTVESGTLTLSYTFVDENNEAENGSVIVWEAADPATKVYSPITGVTGKTLSTTELQDKYIRAKITPISVNYPQGDVVETEVVCRLFKPLAEDVTVSGEVKIGKTLTATYTYVDYNRLNENDPDTENGTTYLWKHSKVGEDAEYTDILDENGLQYTGSTYTITEANIDRYIKCFITPKKDTAEGEATPSNAFACPTTPVAEDVKIDGSVKAGNTVTGSYTFKNGSGVAQGTSEYRWYLDGALSGTEISYTIPSNSAGKTLSFGVIPVAVEEPKTGVEVISTAVTIGAADSSGGTTTTYISSGKNTTLGGNVSSRDSDLISGFSSGTVPETNLSYFDDVATDHWAFEYIDYLHNHGIVSGKGNNCFKPNDTSLRVEMAKIICLAYGLEGTSDTTVFGDVDKTSWYFPYVVAAYENEVIKGKTADTFGVNANVTREELCTMLYRLEEDQYTDYELTFSDADEIAPYAREAVAYYAGKGIIAGYGDNTFRPKKYCTRAETAKIICSIIRH